MLTIFRVQILWNFAITWVKTAHFWHDQYVKWTIQVGVFETVRILAMLAYGNLSVFFLGSLYIRLCAAYVITTAFPCG